MKQNKCLVTYLSICTSQFRMIFYLLFVIIRLLLLHLIFFRSKWIPKVCIQAYYIAVLLLSSIQDS